MMSFPVCPRLNVNLHLVFTCVCGLTGHSFYWLVVVIVVSPTGSVFLFVLVILSILKFSFTE